ncbi:MAG: hypothetical protein SGBAC_004751 [Bacillariaceae sp.]
MSAESDGPTAKWFNLLNLKPNLSWTLSSKGKPLPNWAPAWESLTVSALYDHAQSKSKRSSIPLPTQLDAMASIQVPQIDANLQIQPIWNVSRNTKTWLVQIQKGSCQLLARVANQGLSMVKGCWQCDRFPIQQSVIGGMRITPQFDLLRSQPSCLLEATTSSQRTKTVLHLEHQNPTLKIVHALDDRHVIAPEISLYNAKITYQWDLRLDSGSLRTFVDPTKAIQMTWTDLTPTGRWVTDVKLPLVGTTWKQLAADVRVRRQFRF